MDKPLRIAQLNVTATLSTGNLAAGLARQAQAAGHESLLCFGRYAACEGVPCYRIGDRPEQLRHLLRARLTDRAGFGSRKATEQLVAMLVAWQPDVLHLHNLHGYYLHLPTLFEYLRRSGVPALWTLHDCWAFTGHCVHYDLCGCDRWREGCHGCPQRRAYPQSLLLDQSARNWREKRALFTGLPNLRLTAPSRWLAGQAGESFLAEYPVRVLPNGVDLSVFQPEESDLRARYDLEGRKVLLGVASSWGLPGKRLCDYPALAALLPEGYQIVLLGVTERERRHLPASVLALPRTQTARELAQWYTAADVCLSLSREESMGLTLPEALACGTQVCCWNATGVAESVTEAVGSAVPAGELSAMAEALRALCEQPKPAEACRARAEEYDKRKLFAQTIALYEEMAAPTPEPPTARTLVIRK